MGITVYYIYSLAMNLLQVILKFLINDQIIALLILNAQYRESQVSMCLVKKKCLSNISVVKLKISIKNTSPLDETFHVNQFYY